MTDQKIVGNEVEVAGAHNDAAGMDAVMSKLAAFSDAPMVYSTFDANDVESQKVLAMAVTDAQPLNEFLNKPFYLKNFVVQATTMIDDKTGEEVPILRIILITADGKAYSCAADGIFKVLQTYTGILGHPNTWPAEGHKMQAVEQKSRRGFRYLTLKLV